MKPEEFASYDGLRLAQLVRRAEVSPGELLDVAVATVTSKGSPLFKDNVADHDSEITAARTGGEGNASGGSGGAAGLNRARSVDEGCYQIGRGLIGRAIGHTLR